MRSANVPAKTASKYLSADPRHDWFQLCCWAWYVLMPLKTVIKITAVSVWPHRKVFVAFNFSSASRMTANNYLWERSSGCWDSTLECTGQRCPRYEWWHSNLPSKGFLLKLRMNPILEPAAACDPPALAAQVHPPCCKGSGPAASSFDCPTLEPEKSSSQLQHLQFNPRERSRFEDKSEAPCSCYCVQKRPGESVQRGDAALFLMYLSRQLIGSGFPHTLCNFTKPI